MHIYMYHRLKLCTMYTAWINIRIHFHVESYFMISNEHLPYMLQTVGFQALRRSRILALQQSSLQPKSTRMRRLTARPTVVTCTAYWTGVCCLSSLLPLALSRVGSYSVLYQNSVFIPTLRLAGDTITLLWSVCVLHIELVNVIETKLL